MLKRLLVLIIFCFLSVGLSGQDLMHIRIDSINSPYDEFNPAVSPDGNTLYVTKRGHAQNVAGVIDLGDIWYAHKTQPGWTKLMHAGNVLNHQGLNGVVGFSADGNRMYLLNYFDPDGNGGGNLRNGISVSSRVNDRWSKPERLNIKYFQNKSTHLSASISRDERILILSMESYTTEGNEDLYVSFKQDNGEWTQPQGLGVALNTYGQEWTPHLASDNRTLYFSSNGHEGYGSRDIFLSVRNEGSWTDWSEPMNLGPQINTDGVELGMFIPSDGSQAYFSSTQNSEGRGDIFNFPIADKQEEPIQETIVAAPVVIEEVDEEPQTQMDSTDLAQIEKDWVNLVALSDSTQTEVQAIDSSNVVAPLVVAEEKQEPKLQPTKPEEVVAEPAMVVMTFQVLDAETEKPIAGKVTLINGREETTFETMSLEDDQKFMKAFREGDSISVRIKAAGYLDFKEVFVAMATPSNLDDEFGSNVEAFYMTRKQVGTSVRIENVFFKRGSASFLDPEIAHSQIDEIVVLMNENRDIHIRLEGHTDSMGDAQLLKSLSEARVKTVKRYLVSQGIAAERIEVAGMGGSKPVASNDSQAGREMNRRVEFVIIK